MLYLPAGKAISKLIFSPQLRLPKKWSFFLKIRRLQLVLILILKQLLNLISVKKIMTLRKISLSIGIALCLISITLNSCDLFQADCFDCYQESDFEFKAKKTLTSLALEKGNKITKTINTIINSKPTSLNKGIRLNLSKNLLANNVGLNSFLDNYKLAESVSEVCYSREWINKQRPHMYDPVEKIYSMVKKDYYKSKVIYLSNQREISCELYFTVPTPYHYLDELSELTLPISRIPKKETITFSTDSISLEKIHGFNFTSPSNQNEQGRIYQTTYQYNEYGLITKESYQDQGIHVDYEYLFSTTKGDFLKVEVKVDLSSKVIGLEDEAFVTVFFDRKFNWIKIEYPDIVELRSISY
ncbi:MAG: hypothetical protein AB8G15_01295 [Saprospiraceae bacterium]